MGSPNYIEVTLEFSQEGELWVGRCRELDVASQGKSRDHAFEMVLEAVELYLDTLDEHGELEEVFRQKGITLKHVAKPVRAQTITVETVLDQVTQRIRIPVPA